MKNIKPFGPSIGKTKISKKFLEILNKEIDNKDLTKIPSQTSPNFNSMYQHNNTPLQDAETPGVNEPMAANSGMGAFSSF